MRASIDLWQRVHPVKPATQSEVAAHQAGYSVVAEAEGLRVEQAEIHPEQAGWAGSVHASPGVDWNSRTPPTQAGGLRADAISTLAGPAALAMFAGGDFLSLPIEIMTVASMVTGIAEIEGTSFAVALDNVTEHTARLLHFHRNGILNVAHRLTRDWVVSRSDPPIAKVLATVRAIPHDALPPVPQAEAELARLVASAPVDLAALGRGVARQAQDDA